LFICDGPLYISWNGFWDWVSIWFLLNVVGTKLVVYIEIFSTIIKFLTLQWTTPWLLLKTLKVCGDQGLFIDYWVDDHTSIEPLIPWKHATKPYLFCSLKTRHVASFDGLEKFRESLKIWIWLLLLRRHVPSLIMFDQPVRIFFFLMYLYLLFSQPKMWD